MPTRAILRHIEQLGYTVKTRPHDDGAELFAVKLDNAAVRHAITISDPADEEERYKATCRLAQMVGMDG